jgi:hypothetical protein
MVMFSLYSVEVLKGPCPSIFIVTFVKLHLLFAFLNFGEFFLARTVQLLTLETRKSGFLSSLHATRKLNTYKLIQGLRFGEAKIKELFRGGKCQYFLARASDVKKIAKICVISSLVLVAR